MPLNLPPNLTETAFRRALDAFTGVVGADWVFATDADRDAYTDTYALDETTHAPAAAVVPRSTDEVRAIVRLANEHKVPLWPISRGKNLGYGGAALRLRGSVVLDLSRLNRILELDERQAYCLLEPGVGFFDLYAELQRRGATLWPSVPGNAWGSVIGNALERGVGYTPYGDHSAKICGMEVVLPDGDLVRTGMGALGKGSTWQLYRYGFGPCWDQLFVQSNFGIVTKMGLWLMPAPEATLSLSLELPEQDDIGWAIDTIAPLRLAGVIQQNPSIGNYFRIAAQRSTRAEWYQGEGALPDTVVREILRTYGIGWWSLNLTLFGHPEINEVNARTIRDAVARYTNQEFRTRPWLRGEPIENSGLLLPSTLALQNVNWYGGRGGHIAFSPVLPSRGDLAIQRVRDNKRRYQEFGIDYHPSFIVGERHINNVNQILFDRDDPRLCTAAHGLFTTLLEDAARDGFGEYRTHLSYMDPVAAMYDFNDHALRRLNEKVKNALDPNGILAPGKSGIWPAAYAGERS